MSKPAGRPPFHGDKRTRLVQFYLTEKEADLLKTASELGKFKGVSTFLTALVEPIIQGGLSLQSACRSLGRIQAKMEREGAPLKVNWRVIKEATRDLFSPPPPIPDDVEDIPQLIKDLRALADDLETQTRTQTTTPK